MGTDVLETSEDAVLGGRLRLRQPLAGHRVGHDAILLAAATGGLAPANMRSISAPASAPPGSRWRRALPGSRSRWSRSTRRWPRSPPAMRGSTGWTIASMRSPSTSRIGKRSRAALVPGSVDRVLMNPPFLDATRQNLSPDPRRRLAHAAAPGLLPRWIAAAADLLKPQGVLTLIWRADALAAVQGALAAEFGGIGVLPVYPRPDAAAIRVLVRAVKSGGGPPVSYPGLILNDRDGKPSAAAEAVLRGGGTLKITET